jgi:hypothetical protein
MHNGKGRGTLYTVQKFKKLCHKNAIKHKNRGPIDFLTTSSAPSKEFDKYYYCIYDCG